MYRRFGAALSVAAVLLLGTACTPEPTVTIPSISAGTGELQITVGIPAVPGGVDPQEGALVAHVYAAAINAAGVSARVQTTPVAAGAEVAAVSAGTLDIAPVFSRIALSGITGSGSASDESSDDASTVLATLKAALPNGVVLLDPTKAPDKDALVVTAVTAEKYQLKSLADLGPVCEKLVMGGPDGFKDRSRGLAGIGNDYNCVPQSYKVLQATAESSKDGTLWSLLRDDIQIADIHASSPAIEDNSLVVLEDPKGLFASQDLVPIVDARTVPVDVQSVVNKVSAALSTEEMTNLNRLSQDRHFGGLDEVAKAWLKQKR